MRTGGQRPRGEETNRKERGRKNGERRNGGGIRTREERGCDARITRTTGSAGCTSRIRGATSARGHAPPPSQYAPCHQPLPTFLSSPVIMLRGTRADAQRPRLRGVHFRGSRSDALRAPQLNRYARSNPVANCIDFR